MVKDINKRLAALKAEEAFETYKVSYFTAALLFAMAGTLMILVGTSSTVLFAAEPYNPTLIAFGGLFCVPMLIWTKLMWWPSKPERMRRRLLRNERKSSKGPAVKVFDKITESARKFAEPPPRRIKVVANVRKKDIPVVASTWKSFCEEIEHQTGLPIERQIVKFRDEELKIDLKLKMDEDYGLDTGDRLFIYNRGGFTTSNSPIRKQYEAMTTPAQVEKPEDDLARSNSWMENAMQTARNSFRDKAKGQGQGKGNRDSQRGEGRPSFQKKGGTVSWNV